jgi:hypothetical protein
MVASIPASALALGSWVALIPGFAFSLATIRRAPCEELILEGELAPVLPPTAEGPLPTPRRCLVSKTTVIAVTTETWLEGRQISACKGITQGATFAHTLRHRRGPLE